MNPQPLSLDNGFFAGSRQWPIAQIGHFGLAVPTQGELEEEASELLAADDIGRECGMDTMPFPAVEPDHDSPCDGATHDFQITSPSLPRRKSSSVGSLDGKHTEYEMVVSNLRLRRDNAQFQGVHPALLAKTKPAPRIHNARQQRLNNGGYKQNPAVPALPALPLPPLNLESWTLPSQPLGQPLNGPLGVIPPLTPPEECDSFQWEAPFEPESTGGLPGVLTASNVQPSRNRGPAHSAARPNSSVRPSGIHLPDRTNMAATDSNRSSWLERASYHLSSALGDMTNQQQVHMVVQALPPRSRKGIQKQTFEQVVEEIQTQFTLPPYITITHAVSQAISMEDVPASPPATPNTNHPSDDYFQDQTIFTHAAIAPTYHSHAGAILNTSRASGIVVAPNSTQISVLERYIPPTTPQEVTDFFTLSRRSYLADRLVELSSNDGTLLLVYPTKKGGVTFADKYIGPVIEPFLRQFVLLNSLYTAVAIELGQMAAVSGMKSFDEMRSLLEAMCEGLGSRSPSRALPSRWDIIHCEAAEVVLDRAVWKDWYTEQEQPRLRQNLVDYHQAGGRMPTRGLNEVTPGMLAREVVDGVRQSRQAAGDAGIEVGVFVIRRSMVAS